MSGGYEAVVDLLSEENGIDIISCATDTIAAGAIEALIAQSKKEVPSRFRILVQGCYTFWNSLVSVSQDLVIIRC